MLDTDKQSEPIYSDIWWSDTSNESILKKMIAILWKIICLCEQQKKGLEQWT